MIEKTCCFTGHRSIPAAEHENLCKKLENAVETLIKKGYRYFGSGGALGFDTVAAQTVLKLKEKYPSVKLILVLPCKNQPQRWSEQDKRDYEEIKRKADKCTYVSESYQIGFMHKRNRFLVDNSSACICYLSQNSGGTAYTVKYAKSKGLKIINLHGSKYTDEPTT